MTDPEVGKLRQSECISVAEDDGALHQVAQLVHVAGKGIALKQRLCCGMNRVHVFAEFRGIEAQEVESQEQYVITAIAQWWHMDGKDIEAKEEILTEAAVPLQLIEILICRGDQAHIDGDFPGSTNATDSSSFEGAQQLALGLMSAISSRKRLPPLLSSNIPFTRSRASVKAPFSCPIELTLKERIRNGRAVDADEGGTRPGTQAVDGAGDKLLPGAAFDGDEHGGPIRRSDLVDKTGNSADRVTLADDGRFTIPDIDVVLERCEARLNAILLASQRLKATGAFERDGELFEADGLGEEIESAFAQGVDGRLQIAVTSDENELHVLALLIQGSQKPEAVYIWHHDVADDDVDPRAGVEFEPLAAVSALNDLVAETFENGCDRLAHRPVIVDEQDFQLGLIAGLHRTVISPAG